MPVIDRIAEAVKNIANVAQEARVQPAVEFLDANQRGRHGVEREREQRKGVERALG